MTILDQLKRDEGLRLSPYKDSVGKLTIGYGRNLSDVGITTEEATVLLANDLERTVNDLSKCLPWVSSLDDARRSVFTNMAFNMGIHALLEFNQMLAAAQAGDWEKAAEEMVYSKWADQVGARAQRLAQQMRTGEWQ